MLYSQLSCYKCTCTCSHYSTISHYAHDLEVSWVLRHSLTSRVNKNIHFNCSWRVKFHLLYHGMFESVAWVWCENTTWWQWWDRLSLVLMQFWTQKNVIFCCENRTDAHQICIGMLTNSTPILPRTGNSNRRGDLRGVRMTVTCVPSNRW